MGSGLRRRSGRPARVRHRTPVLFVIKIDDEGESFAIDYTSVDDLRLWTMARIRRIYAAREESDENALAWGVYRTNYEGCLVKRRRLASLSARDDVSYRFHFSTIPLARADIKAACLKYKTDKAIKLEDTTGKTVVRPYPTEIRSGANTNFPDKLYVVAIPSKALGKAGKLGKLSYWQTVMYHESTDKEIDPYRRLRNRASLSHTDLKELSELLGKMRGMHMYSILAKRKVEEIPGAIMPRTFVEGRRTVREARLPNVLNDRRYPITDDSLRRTIGGEQGMIQDGPWWFYSVSEDFAESKAKVNKEGKIEPDEKGEGGNQLHLYDLSAKYKLPEATNMLPKVTDTVLEEIKNAVAPLFQNYSNASAVRDGDVFSKILETLKKSSHAKSAEFIRRYFYLSLAKNHNQCVMFGLDGAARHWRTSIKYEQEDIASGGATRIIIPTHVVAGFATGCDGFSESGTPKHVYVQLRDWYYNLCKTDKDEIKSSYEIFVKGYTSALGRADFNERLRGYRAWKTAQSLKKLLEADGWKLNVTEGEPSTSNPQTKPTGPVPLHYYGADMKKEPKVDPSMYSPAGSTVLDLLENSPEARVTVRGVPVDNDPHDRVCVIEFRRALEVKTVQYVKQKASYNAAHALGAYRVLLDRELGDQRLMLMYAVPAYWKP